MIGNDEKYVNKIVDDFKALLTEASGVRVYTYVEDRNAFIARYRGAYKLNADDFEWLKREYGVTGDFLSAGWILPDGDMLDFRRLDDNRRLLHTDMKMPPRIADSFGGEIRAGEVGTEDIMLESGCTRIGNMPADLSDGVPSYMIQQLLPPTDPQKDMLAELSDLDMSRYSGGEITFQAYGQSYKYDSPESFNKFFFNNVLNANYAG